MSFQTTPVGLVITAIAAGRVGRRTLPRRLEQAFGRQARLESLESQREVADAGRLDRLDVQLQSAVGFVQVHPAVNDDPQPGLRPRTRTGAGRRGTTRTGAGFGVLRREVRVAGRRDRDPADLTLDPQVGQSRIRADGDRGSPGCPR